MATPDKLAVFIYLDAGEDAYYAGEYRYDPEFRVGSFRYDYDYLATPRAASLDPVSLPLGPDDIPIKTPDGLPGAFRDGLPDYWGRLVLAREMGRSEFDLPLREQLLAGDGTRVGRLDFRARPYSKALDHTLPILTTLPDLLETAQAVLHNKPTDPRLLGLLRRGGSLGGGRPKCIIETDNGQWLAKFGAPGDSYNVPKLEYATLILARRAGLSVPEVAMETIDDQDVLMIRRFDRTLVNGHLARHGYLSAQSLLGVQHESSASYPGMAQAMAKLNMPSADQASLFQRMVFNILVHNTDDHLRNHGYIDVGSGYRLAPAFDVLPIGKQWREDDYYQAIGVGMMGRLASMDNALTQAGLFGLSGQQAAQVALTTARAIERNWQQTCLDAGMDEYEVRYFGPAFGGAGQAAKQLAPLADEQAPSAEDSLANLAIPALTGGEAGPGEPQKPAP